MLPDLHNILREKNLFTMMKLNCKDDNFLFYIENRVKRTKRVEPDISCWLFVSKT